jgi:hypothetical protein
MSRFSRRSLMAGTAAAVGLLAAPTIARAQATAIRWG